jgi:hypothetical protein
MVVLWPTKASLRKWQAPEPQSLKHNTFPRGEESNPLARRSVRLYVLSALMEVRTNSADSGQGIQFVTDKWGRKVTLYVIWIIMVVVST